MSSSEQNIVDILPNYFLSFHPWEEFWSEKKGNTTTTGKIFHYPLEIIVKKEAKYVEPIVLERNKILIYHFPLEDTSIVPFNENTKKLEIDMKSCKEEVEQLFALHKELKLSFQAKGMALREDLLFVGTDSHVSLYNLKAKAFTGHYPLRSRSNEIHSILIVNDTLFVSELNCISTFAVNANGIEFQHSFGAEHLESPKRMAFHAGSQRLFVVDSLEKGKKSRVAVFDMNQNFVHYFLNVHECCMEGISIDGNFISVTDSKLNRIQIYSYDGTMKDTSNPLYEFGAGNSESDGLHSPKGISSFIPTASSTELIHKELYLFVCDESNSRVLIFRLYRTIENTAHLIHQLQITSPFSFCSASKFVPVEELSHIYEFTKPDDKFTYMRFMTPLQNRFFAYLSQGKEESLISVCQLTPSNEISTVKSITISQQFKEISAFKYHENKYYIADSGHDTVYEYSDDGTKLHEYKIPKTRSGRLRDFCIYSDQLLVLDQWGKANHGIAFLHLYSLKNQKCLKSFENIDRKQLHEPSAIAVDEQRNLILVADERGITVSIKIFSLENGKFIASFGVNDLESANHIIVDDKYKILDTSRKLILEYDPDRFALVHCYGNKKQETWTDFFFQDNLLVAKNMWEKKIQIFQLDKTRNMDTVPTSLNYEFPYGYPVYEFGSPFKNKFNKVPDEFQAPIVHVSSGVLWITDLINLFGFRTFQLFHNPHQGFHLYGINHHIGFKPQNQLFVYKDTRIISDANEETAGFYLYSSDNLTPDKVIRRGRSHQFLPQHFVVYKDIIYSFGTTVNRGLLGTSCGSSVSLFSLNNAEYLSSWDWETESFSECGGIEISEEKEWILFSDCGFNGLVKAFDLNGKFIKKFGEHILEKPRGIATRGDDCFVVDEKRHAVFVFSLTTGNLKLKFGRKGHGFGEFLHPTTIQLLNGLIIVGDEWNHRVQIFI